MVVVVVVVVVDGVLWLSAELAVTSSGGTSHVVWFIDLEWGGAFIS